MATTPLRTTTTARGTRRKKRRRVHRGRLSIVVLALAAVIALVVFLFNKCTGNGADEVPAVVNEHVAEASACGRQDAQQVLDTQSGTMERQNALLHIKAREYKLRSSGFAKAADDYKKAAEKILKAHHLM